MSRLGFKSVVYHGDVCLGQLDAIPVSDTNFQFPNNEIRIHHISPTSERCIPLSILHAVSPFPVRCKLESSSPVEQPHLIHLHASCFYEFKTAVVLVGVEEVHLVTISSKQKKFPCFWCFSVPTGLYNSCLGMLNLRCLAIVFDLDETLIVANTMKSFEDRIEALRGWIARETDSIRLSGMSAELRRYMDDRLLLKQYTESDCVVDNGKVFKVQMEEVPPLSDGHEKVVRPVIRLQERNIVLTRINPECACETTSCLGGIEKLFDCERTERFEVYVCTMAERDYALEMWRLLDPEAHLIGSKQLLDRVVCVKSGSRKSLLNVFQDGKCHPQMAMVIDDRSKVWEDKDQPRVHVVPPFAPYYAPQAETANAVPVLCVARNVACNVRGLFFKEFDENVLRKISEVFYEDEAVNLPLAPDVSNYLMSEDAGFAPNGNSGAPISEGMNGVEVEVERRLNQSFIQEEKHVLNSSSHPVTNNPELRSETSQPPVAIVPNVIGSAFSTAPLPSQKPSLLGAPGLLSPPILLGASVRRDSTTSDSDYDVKRRALGAKQGLDLRNQSSIQPPLLSKLPAQISSSSILPQGGWLVEEDVDKPHLNDRSSGSAQESDATKSDKLQGYQNPFSHNTPGPVSTGLPSNESQMKVEEACAGLNLPKHNVPPAAHVSEIGGTQSHVASISRELQFEGGKVNFLPSHLSISVLQEIGRRCGSKVEFRSVVSTSKDLQFSVEVFYTGEKIGVGMGKTRRDAQQQAAELALRNLAEKYVAYIDPRSESGAVDRDFNKLSLGTENGFLWDVNPASNEALREDGLPKDNTSEAAEVEPGSNSPSLVNQAVQKRANSPRLSESMPSKRSKEKVLRRLRSLPSSRQPKNEHPVP